MNRFFVPGEHTREMPGRLYARIDAIERSNAVDPDSTVVILDAVDADWRGFDVEGPLSLRDGRTPDRVAAYWGRRFNRGEPGEGGGDPFEGLPLFRVEVTVKGRHPIIDLFADESLPWLELVVDDTAPIEIDVFAGLFSEPTATAMHLPRVAAVSPLLDRVFSMDSWPDASPETVDAHLTIPCDLEQLIAFDIGQGSANALVCRCGQVTHYFDLGCGSGRNAPTKPAIIKFCAHEPPPVILSHWDTDHWAAAALDPGCRRWTGSCRARDRSRPRTSQWRTPSSARAGRSR